MENILQIQPSVLRQCTKLSLMFFHLEESWSWRLRIFHYHNQQHAFFGQNKWWSICVSHKMNLIRYQDRWTFFLQVRQMFFLQDRRLCFLQDPQLIFCCTNRSGSQRTEESLKSALTCWVFEWLYANKMVKAINVGFHLC